RGMKLGWLISPSVDGEIGAMLVHRLGAHAIRGSSTHTGARALRDYYQALVKENISPAITPDGPRGPRNQFKPGTILLAQLSGRAHRTDGLRGHAGLAHQMGRVRHPQALRPGRHCDRPAPPRTPGARCPGAARSAARDGRRAAPGVRDGPAGARMSAPNPRLAAWPPRLKRAPARNRDRKRADSVKSATLDR
ncbi:protein containing DUF374, partial [mine drainage metagenome]